MLKLDLKTLLHISTSSNEILRGRKRFNLGKNTYSVTYELRGHELVVKRIKNVRVKPSLETRVHKRRKLIAGIIKNRRRAQETINYERLVGEQSFEGGDGDGDESLGQSSYMHDVKCCDSCGQYFNDCCSLINDDDCLDPSCSYSVHTDTDDLIMQMQQEQQTLCQDSRKMCTQTDNVLTLWKTTQTDCKYNSLSTQTIFKCTCLEAEGILSGSLPKEQVELLEDKKIPNEVSSSNSIIQTLGLILTQHDKALKANTAMLAQLSDLRVLDHIKYKNIIERFDDLQKRYKKLKSRRKLQRKGLHPKKMLPIIKEFNARHLFKMPKLKRSCVHINRLPMRVSETKFKETQTETTSCNSDIATQTIKKQHWLVTGKEKFIQMSERTFKRQ